MILLFEEWCVEKITKRNKSCHYLNSLNEEILMKKFVKNPWVVGVGTTVIGGITLSFVLDWIKGVNCMSTFKGAIEFITKYVGAFLNAKLKVWWVLITIALIIVALIIIAKFLDAKEKSTPISFMSYTKDFVMGFNWEWEYKKLYGGNYTISNLHPVCSKCGMRLKQSGMYGWEMKCLRCNTSQKWEDHYLTDAQLLIEDNIKKKFTQEQ